MKKLFKKLIQKANIETLAYAIRDIEFENNFERVNFITDLFYESISLRKYSVSSFLLMNGAKSDDLVKMAVLNQNPKLLLTLCNYGESTNPKDGNFDRSPLRFALSSDNEIITRILILFGANLPYKIQEWTNIDEFHSNNEKLLNIAAKIDFLLEKIFKNEITFDYEKLEFINNNLAVFVARSVKFFKDVNSYELTRFIKYFVESTKNPEIRSNSIASDLEDRFKSILEAKLSLNNLEQIVVSKFFSKKHDLSIKIWENILSFTENDNSLLYNFLGEHPISSFISAKDQCYDFFIEVIRNYQELSFQRITSQNISSILRSAKYFDKKLEDILYSENYLDFVIRNNQIKRLLLKLSNNSHEEDINDKDWEIFPVVKFLDTDSDTNSEAISKKSMGFAPRGEVLNKLQPIIKGEVAECFAEFHFREGDVKYRVTDIFPHEKVFIPFEQAQHSTSDQPPCPSDMRILTSPLMLHGEITLVDSHEFSSDNPDRPLTGHSSVSSDTNEI